MKGGKSILKKCLKIFVPILIIITTIIIVIIPKGQEMAKVENTQDKKLVQEEQETIHENQETNENWKIEIPEIALVASISEGTDEETLKKYVGHFSITPKEKGNIGLAAHNRGYPINYFENLKQLKGGEEIIYTYGEFTKTYVVEQNIKISDVDWSYLENSNENKITLITCIENEPAYRRCVQAVEKEEK